jgi:hypothetical protein
MATDMQPQTSPEVGGMGHQGYDKKERSYRSHWNYVNSGAVRRRFSG